MLSKVELDLILSKIDLEGFKQEIKVKNETRGRKPKVVINYWRETLLDLSYDELNGWVDDVLTGAGRLSTGNSKVSGKMVFALLKGVPTITTSEIKSFINRKRIISGDFVDGDRYCRWLMSVLESAMKSLDYHTEQGKKLARFTEGVEDSFKLSEDAKGWEEHKSKCKALGLPVRTHLDNPLCFIPLNDRKLLAGLTVDEIAGIKPIYTTSEINLPDITLFIKRDEPQSKLPDYTRKEFEEICNHPFEQYQNIPLEMVDIDTGEIYIY